MRRVAVLSLLFLSTMTPASAEERPRCTPVRQGCGARIEDFFGDEAIARAKAYHGPRYALSIGALLLSFAVLAILGTGRGTRALGRGTDAIAGEHWVLHTILLSALVTAVVAVATLGPDLLRYRHDRAFGIATNTVPEFLRDVALVTGFQFLLSAIGAVTFVGIARLLPRAWPVAVAGAGTVLTVALVFVLPVVYEPAFNRFAPVDAATKARVLGIAARAGVEVKDVLVSDASRRTSRSNAYVSGLGSTRRVVLYDTLLQGFDASEVDVVVVHELAHVKHRDVLKGTALGIVGLFAGILVLWLVLGSAALRRWLGIAGPGDPRVVPFLIFFVAIGNLLTLPLANAYSRRIEARADRFALEITGDPLSAIEVETKLARDNIADLDPHPIIRWVFFSHPPTLERIQIALDHPA